MEDIVQRLSTREDFHQSIFFGRVMEGIGWSSIPVHGARIAVRQLGPVSIAKMQRATTIDCRALAKLRRDLHIFRTIIEPACTGILFDLQGRKHHFSFINTESCDKALRLFRKSGYTVSREHYAHTKTALLDLSRSIEDVVSSFPSKARYNIKISQRKINTYQVKRFDDLQESDKEQFFSLHTKWASEKKIYGFSNDFLRKVMSCFGKKGWLVSAATNDSFSGGMMVLVHDKVAYYFYTCTSDDGKKNHVPSGLLAKALEMAKLSGADIFDFCSVFDERYPQDHPRWKGFTEFKSRFDPIFVYYPPSFSRWL